MNTIDQYNNSSVKDQLTGNLRRVKNSIHSLFIVIAEYLKNHIENKVESSITTFTLKKNSLLEYLGIKGSSDQRTRKIKRKTNFSKFKELSVSSDFNRNLSVIEYRSLDFDFLTRIPRQPSQAKWFDNVFSSSIKALMRQIKQYLSITLLRFKNFKHLLSTSITLLFGLCCSSLSIAFDAFASTRSARIFSI